MVNQSYEKSEKNLQGFDWYIQGFFDFGEPRNNRIENTKHYRFFFFFKLIFFLFFCNGKYDRDDHLYVIDCCAKIAKKKYVIALLPGRRILTYITLSATRHYRIYARSRLHLEKTMNDGSMSERIFHYHLWVWVKEVPIAAG